MNVIEHEREEDDRAMCDVCAARPADVLYSFQADDACCVFLVCNKCKPWMPWQGIEVLCER